MARTRAARAEALPASSVVFREPVFRGPANDDERIGFGKDALYAFQGGKEEMAILLEIDIWFEARIFEPLREPNSRRAIARMCKAVEDYFKSGRRLCLAGALPHMDARELLARRIHGYCARWRDALARALVRLGHSPANATALSERTLAAIQSGLVLARAMDDSALFQRRLARLKRRLLDR